MNDRFHTILKEKIHNFVMFSYEICKNLPPQELYGISSQLRRASMSIMLNYVEGYARRRDKVKLNFYEISHGSTQECKYIIYFVYKQTWINQDVYTKSLNMVDEIGKMLWSTIDQLEEKIVS
jgi:four helix bundle protein